jgi:hypothetical protein
MHFNNLVKKYSNRRAKNIVPHDIVHQGTNHCGLPQ